MSMHRTPLTEIEEAGLRSHGLDIGTPSQLSDVFRQGLKYGQSAFETEIVELKQQLEDMTADRNDCLALAKSNFAKILESQAREARLLSVFEEISELMFCGKKDQLPGRCDKASKLIIKTLSGSLKRDDTALKEYRDVVIEECAVICEKSDRYRGDYFAAKLREIKAP